MRLLHVHDLTFKQFHGTIREPYAILTHRWGHREVMLADVEQAQGDWTHIEDTKVHGFARYIRAHYPQLKWLWVDSCCIRQDNQLELSEAVNSMFDWYEKADICIAYMADLSTTSTEDFPRSAWFERGWTLQELVAAKSVVFLTDQWKVIGHKGQGPGPNLDAAISFRTDVPLDVLADFANSRRLSRKQKMQWMEGRVTLRDEDMVYALYGIFGVTPGANYGEGKNGAERRLLAALQQKDTLTSGNADDRELFNEIVDWLECSSISQFHADMRQLHEPDTGSWLLRSVVYGKWLSGGHIWLNGKPGSGKTILCSTVVDDLETYCQKHGALSGAYYCSTMSYDDLLRALIRQWAWREPAMSLLRQRYEQIDRRIIATQGLEEIVCAACQPFSRVFLVLDGVQPGINMDLLRRLEMLTERLPLHLFVASRDFTDIRSTMKFLAATEVVLDTQDVDIYISNQLANHPSFRWNLSPDDKRKVHDSIMKRTGGRFWRVKCLFSDLHVRGVAAIEEKLARFPTNNWIQRESVRLLGWQDRVYLLVLLQWLAYSYEPLTLGQLLEVLTAHPHSTSIDECTYEDVLDLLWGFIDLAHYSEELGESLRIRLAHPRVLEYVTSDVLPSDIAFVRLDSQSGHQAIMHACITYMIQCGASGRRHPLLDYVLKWWSQHARAHDLPVHGTGLIAKLQETANFRRPNKQKYEDAMYAACVKDYGEVVRLFLELGMDVQTPSLYMQPLHAACQAGSATMVKLLLDKGADVNVKTVSEESAISLAAALNHENLVDILIAQGADVNVVEFYGTPLYRTAEFGTINTMRALLDAGADPCRESGQYVTPLHVAAVKGGIGTVELLLDRGAKSVKISPYGWPLHLAAQEGHLSTARMLLDKGADVNAEDDERKTALDRARYHDVAQLLRSRGGQMGQDLERAKMSSAASNPNVQEDHAVHEVVAENVLQPHGVSKLMLWLRAMV